MSRQSCLGNRFDRALCISKTQSAGQIHRLGTSKTFVQKPKGVVILWAHKAIDYLAKPSHEELLIISPYLIPLPSFLENLKRLGEEDVEVRILTSGLESTDNRFVNSHYKKYRKPLLQSGAELFELLRLLETTGRLCGKPFKKLATVRVKAKVMPIDRRLEIENLLGDSISKVRDDGTAEVDCLTALPCPDP